MSYYASEEISELEKEILSLKQELKAVMAKNKLAKEALRFYADEMHYQKECCDSNVGAIEEVIVDNGRTARSALEEIKK